MRHICRLVGTTVTILMFSAVSALQSATPPAKPVVLLLLKTQTTAFFQAIEAGARTENARQGNPFDLRVRSGAKEGDITGQRRILDAFFDDYAAGRARPAIAGVLLTAAASGPELVSEIRRYRTKNIPVVLLDTPIDPKELRKQLTDVSGFIASDNKNGGRQAAALLAAALPKGGHVLLLNGVDGQQTAAERRDGFLEELKHLRAHSVTVEQRTCNWSRGEARAAVDGLLSFGNRYDGIFAANDEMALGAIEALRAHPEVRRPKVLLGFDAIPDARAALKAGTMNNTLEQQPDLMGQRGIQMLRDIRAGKKPTNVVIPVRPVLR
jgi:ribose transport system substrate-binding protein